MVCQHEIFVAASGPLVPGGSVVHDPVDAVARVALTVVAVRGWAAQEVVLHAQVVPELVRHVLKSFKKVNLKYAIIFSFF